MAVVFEEALKKNISSGSWLPVYILFGDDGYLVKMYTDKISRAVVDLDDIFAYSRLGGDCDLQDVYDAVMQLPMTSEYKCVVLDDFDFEHCSKNDFERLCFLLSNMPESAVFILRFETVEFDSKKSAKFKKLLASAEKSGGMGVKLDHRKVPELAKMLTDGAAKRGCRMDLTVARYIIENAGDDINLLINELSKLCAYTGKGVITKETVDKVGVKTVEASVYNLSKQIFACNIEASLQMLDELFYMRVEPMVILYAISSVYVDMFRVYAAKSSGENIKAVIETFGYKGREFTLEKAAQNLAKFDFKRLVLSINAITEADKSLKSFGAQDRIILEQLVIRLIYIIVKGEAVDKAQ